MSKYIEELVAQQVRRAEIARSSKGTAVTYCPGLVVTISRGMGTGARVIAQKLADDLRWSLWDKELIEAIAQDASVSRRVVEAFDEHSISEIELLARAALGDHEMGDFIYARHLARAVTSIAKLGNAIILGRGANFILPDALTIRFEASFDYRVRNMIAFEDMSEETAIHKIRQSDRDREHFLERTFGKEKVHNVHYDLIIRMDKFENEDVADMIKVAVKARCRAMAES